MSELEGASGGSGELNFRSRSNGASHRSGDATDSLDAKKGRSSKESEKPRRHLVGEIVSE